MHHYVSMILFFILEKNGFIVKQQNLITKVWSDVCNLLSNNSSVPCSPHFHPIHLLLFLRGALPGLEHSCSVAK